MVHCIMHVAHDVYCCPFFLGGGGLYTSIHRKIITVIPYHLIFNALKMLQNTSAVNVTNRVVIDFANDVLLV